MNNVDAQVPAVCYAKTEGRHNTCWTCHTIGVPPNFATDFPLQIDADFSPFSRTNHWANLFADQRATAKRWSDAAILTYIRQDNLADLRDGLSALAARGRYPGFVPDLDFSQGFDARGFARDGSGWRAVRYKPFPGAFWPTNGSAGDVMVRLPRAFRSDDRGQPNVDVYAENLAILERTVASAPEARVTIPDKFVGAAADQPVRRHLFPEGTEFLHTVRYVDPDQPTLLAARMKEVRYMRKVIALDQAGRIAAHAEDDDRKEKGYVPKYAGSPLVGYRNDFGWQLQAFIEDAEGALRVQTEEEHRTCLGCHGAIGVTVDNTFSFARKVPGDDGWRPQDLRGMPDVPQSGHARGEVLTYFERALRGDDFGSNQELRARFFASGQLDVAAVARAAIGGDRDLTHLIVPSRARALALAKAYRAIVVTQSFTQGRDALVDAPAQAHPTIKDTVTGLAPANRVYHDGRIWLDWGGGAAVAGAQP